MNKYQKPDLLKKGAVIAIAAPSESLDKIDSENICIGIRNLESMGFRIVFSRHVRVSLNHPKSAILRTEDLMELFCDDQIDGVMAAIGGYSSLEVVGLLDYNRISKYRKPFIGFSDITVLSSVLLKRAQLINYYGPTFAVFCQKNLPEYTKRSFLKLVCSNQPTEIETSEVYADDLWYKNNNGKRQWKKNLGWHFYNCAPFSGRIMGGNLETLLALAGTEYMPDFEDGVLFLEEASGKSDAAVRRELQQLKLMGVFSQIRALVFGRFWGWTQESQTRFFDGVMETLLKEFSKPVIINMDFGHSDPMLTIPLGGFVKFNGEKMIFYK